MCVVIVATQSLQIEPKESEKENEAAQIYGEFLVKKKKNNKKSKMFAP